jgi:hypothetical protein
MVPKHHKYHPSIKPMANLGLIIIGHAINLAYKEI